MDYSKKLKEENNLEVDLNLLEVAIEKYPQAESKNMFECFLIII